MDIGFAVDGKAFIVREFLAPGFAAEAVNGPVIPIEPPPQYSTAVLIYILFGSHRIIEALNIHDTNGIVRLASNGYSVAAHHIHHLSGDGSGNAVPLTMQQSLGMQIHLIAAVVLAKAPVVDLKGGDYILIQAVLESEAGQDAFLKRCAYMMRTTLNEAHIMDVIDSIYNDIKSEMPRDRERWNLSYSAWEKQVEGLRKFVRDEARTKAMLKNLKSYFSLTNAEMEHYFGDLTQLIQ